METRRKKIRLNDSTVKEHSTNENQTIEILNDDCLLHIFKYLPICDRVRLERVNKRWQTVSRMSWNSFKSLNFNNNLWGCQNETKIARKALRKVLYLCGRFLKELDMSTTNVLAEKIDMSPLLKFCPDLTSVDFGTTSVGVTLIKSLIENCKKIVELKIGLTTHYVRGSFINDTILSTYTNLQVLNIQHICFFGDWIEFKNNNAIKALNLDYCFGLNLCNLTAVLPQLQNLHALSLRASLDMSERLDNLDFPKLPNLAILDISDNCFYVDDNFLIRIAETCTHLTNFAVGHNYQVTDEGLKAVISSCQLNYLEIDYLNITGSSFSALSSLVGLSCQNCIYIEDEYFQSLFDASNRLERIDLQGIAVVDSIIQRGINYVRSRANNIPLSMYVDEVDEYITDIPDNLKIIPCPNNGEHLVPLIGVDLI